MVKVTSRRSSTTLDIAIAPPFFNWNVVPPKFFEMVHGTLSPKYLITANDFSVVSGNSLGEVAAKYNIFGGPSSVTLHAERLYMDFSTLFPDDVSIVLDIMEQLYTGFHKTFPDRQCETIQAAVGEHVEIIDGTAVSDYLSRYAIPATHKTSGERNIVFTPGSLFVAVDNDATWRLGCKVEKSELLENGLYLHINITFLKVAEAYGNDFQILLDRYRGIVDACSSTLDLDWEGA